MRILHLLLAVVALGLPLAARAQTAPVVVELYTSQGCAYCPPADEILADLAARPDVIALALHVTIWDYLGWKDVFGDKRHDGRQRGYAAKAGKHTVYTPQMVVQGVDRVGGAKHDKALGLIAAHQAAPVSVALDVRREGAVLAIGLAPLDPAGVGPAEIYLVRFNPGEVVDIEAGENAGQRIAYVNVVTDWSRLGDWDGLSPVELSVDLTGPDQAVVIVQRAELGPILSAAVAP